MFKGALSDRFTRSEGKKTGNGSTDEDGVRVYYKKKTANLKCQIIQMEASLKKIEQDLIDSKKREEGIKELCKSQISEISEEFAYKIRLNASKYSEDLKKIAEEQDQKNEELVEKERTIIDLESDLKSCLAENSDLVFRLQNSFKEIEAFQQSEKRSKEETAGKIRQLEEENTIRARLNEELNSELEAKGKMIALLKHEIEVNRLDSIMNSKNEGMLDRVLQENKDLASQLEVAERRNKESAKELEKTRENIKSLEATVKNLNSHTDFQSKELSRLNQALTETEKTLEQQIESFSFTRGKELSAKSEELQLEYAKISQNYRSLENDYQDLQIKLQENQRKFQDCLKEKKNADLIIEKLKESHEKLLFNQRKIVQIKHALKSNTRKFKNFWLVSSKQISQNFSDFFKSLLESSTDLCDFVKFSAGNSKTRQDFLETKLKNDHTLSLVSQEKANKEVMFLKNQVISLSAQLKNLEVANQNLSSVSQTESSKQSQNFILNLLVESVGHLESEASQIFSSFERDIQDLCLTISQESREASQNLQKSMELLEKTEKDCRLKIQKIDEQRTEEKNKSNLEILGIQQMLAETLNEIRTL